MTKNHKFITLISLIVILVISLGIIAGPSLYVLFPLPSDDYVKKFNREFRESLYNPEKIPAALHTISQGIKVYPDRLDLRFGKIFACKTYKNPDCISAEIIDMSRHSVKNNNQWQWLNGETRDKKFMLENIVAYQHDLFKFEADNALEASVRSILQYYPDNCENLNMLGVLYILRNDPDTGEKYLNQAHKLAPDDEIINKNLRELKLRRQQLSERNIH